MNIEETVLSLSDEQKTIYTIMKTIGTDYDTICDNTTKPRTSVRRIMSELKKLGLVVNSTRPGVFRLVVETDG